MHKTDLDIDALLALHAVIFGDARMDATDDEPDDVDVDTPDAADESDDAADDDKGTDALGDAGKQALDRMKAQRNAERQKRRDLEAQLAAATKAAKGDDDTPDLEALREQALTEAQAAVLRDRALDKIEAKAAGKFKDPEDAVLRLGRNLDDFIDDGKIDVDAIAEALDDLLKQRPDFAAQSGKDEKRFKGDADAGDRGGNKAKGQLSEDDVKRLSKEGKHAEIEQARLDGRLNKLLGIS